MPQVSLLTFCCGSCTRALPVFLICWWVWRI